MLPTEHRYKCSKQARPYTEEPEDYGKGDGCSVMYMAQGMNFIVLIQLGVTVYYILLIEIVFIVICIACSCVVLIV
jgi:hypothetical protein